MTRSLHDPASYPSPAHVPSCAGGRKKRRARGDSGSEADLDMDHDMEGAVSGEDPGSGAGPSLHAGQQQLIHYTPNNNGDYSEYFFQQLGSLLSESAPQGQEVVDFATAFDTLQLSSGSSMQHQVRVALLRMGAAAHACMRRHAWVAAWAGGLGGRQRSMHACMAHDVHVH